MEMFIMTVRSFYVFIKNSVSTCKNQSDLSFLWKHCFSFSLCKWQIPSCGDRRQRLLFSGHRHSYFLDIDISLCYGIYKLCLPGDRPQGLFFSQRVHFLKFKSFVCLWVFPQGLFSPRKSTFWILGVLLCQKMSILVPNGPRRPWEPPWAVRGYQIMTQARLPGYIYIYIYVRVRDSPNGIFDPCPWCPLGPCQAGRVVGTPSSSSPSSSATLGTNSTNMLISRR